MSTTSIIRPNGIDSALFRSVMGRFPSGVVVVTAKIGNQLLGMTCQSFVSLSMDPPLIAFAPARSSKTYAELRNADTFAINVLSAGQSDLSKGFARSGTDKWAGVDWAESAHGCPLIRNSVATIECRLEQEHDGGDHYIVVGRVLGLSEGAETNPLVFHRSGYAHLHTGGIL